MAKELNSLNIQISADAQPALKALEQIGKTSTSTNNKLGKLSSTISEINKQLKDFNKTAQSLASKDTELIKFDKTKAGLKEITVDILAIKRHSKDAGDSLKNSLQSSLKYAKQIAALTSKPIKFVDAEKSTARLIRSINDLFDKQKVINKHSLSMFQEAQKSAKTDYGFAVKRLAVEQEIDRLRRKRVGSAERELAIYGEISQKLHSAHRMMEKNKAEYRQMNSAGSPTIIVAPAQQMAQPAQSKASPVETPKAPSTSGNSESPNRFDRFDRLLEKRMNGVPIKTPETKLTSQQRSWLVHLEEVEKASRANTKALQQSTAAQTRLGVYFFAYQKMHRVFGRASEDIQDLQRNRARMESWGLTDKEKEEFYTIADELHKTNSFLTKGGSYNAVMAAASSLGHWDADTIAQTVGDAVAKAQTQKIMGYNDSNIEDIVKNLYGVAEARQVTNDPQKVLDTFKTVQDIVSTTAGKISIGDIETMLRNLGSAALTLSDRGLRHMAALAEQTKVAGHGASGGSGAGVSSVGTQIKMLTLMGMGKPTAKSAKEQMANIGISEDYIYQALAGKNKESILASAMLGGKDNFFARDENFKNIIGDTVAINTHKELAKAGVFDKNLLQSDPVEWIQKIVPLVINYSAEQENRGQYYGQSAQGKEQMDTKEFIKTLTEEQITQAVNTFWAKSGLSHRVVQAVTALSSNAFANRANATLETSYKQTSDPQGMLRRGDLQPVLQQLQARTTDLIQSFEPLARIFGKTINLISSMIDKFSDWVREWENLATMTGAWAIIKVFSAGVTHTIQMYNVLDVATKNYIQILREQTAATIAATSAQNILNGARIKGNVGNAGGASHEVGNGAIYGQISATQRGLTKVKNITKMAFLDITAAGMSMFNHIGMALLAIDIASVLYKWLVEFTDFGKKVDSIVDKIGDSMRRHWYVGQEMAVGKDGGKDAAKSLLGRGELVKQEQELERTKEALGEKLISNNGEQAEVDPKVKEEYEKVNKQLDEIRKQLASIDAKSEQKRKEINAVYETADQLLDEIKNRYANANVSDKLREVAEFDAGIKQAKEELEDIKNREGSASQAYTRTQQNLEGMLKEREKIVDELKTLRTEVTPFLLNLNRYFYAHRDNESFKDYAIGSSEKTDKITRNIEEAITGVASKRNDVSTKVNGTELVYVKSDKKSEDKHGSNVDFKQQAIDAKTTKIGKYKTFDSIMAKMAKLDARYQKSKVMSKVGEGEFETYEQAFERQKEILLADLLAKKIRKKDGTVPFLKHGGVGDTENTVYTKDDFDLSLKDKDTGLTGNDIVAKSALVTVSEQFNKFCSTIIRDLDRTVKSSLEELKASSDEINKFCAETEANPALQSLRSQHAETLARLKKMKPDVNDKDWDEKIRKVERGQRQIEFNKAKVIANNKLTKDREAVESSNLSNMTRNEKLDFTHSQDVRLLNGYNSQAIRDVTDSANALKALAETEEEKARIEKDSEDKIEALKKSHEERMTAMEKDYQNERFGNTELHLKQKIEDWQNFGAQLEGLQDTFMDGFITADEAWLDGDKNAWKKWGNDLLKMLRDMFLKQGMSQLLGIITGTVTDGVGSLFGRDTKNGEQGGVGGIAGKIAGFVGGMFGGDKGGSAEKKPEFDLTKQLGLTNGFDAKSMLPKLLAGDQQGGLFSPNPLKDGILGSLGLAKSGGTATNLMNPLMGGMNPMMGGMNPMMGGMNPMMAMNPMMGGMNPMMGGMMGGMNPMMGGMNPMMGGMMGGMSPMGGMMGGMNPMMGGMSPMGGMMGGMSPMGGGMMGGMNPMGGGMMGGLGGMMGGDSGGGGGLGDLFSGIFDSLKEQVDSLVDGFTSLLGSSDTVKEGLTALTDTSDLFGEGMTALNSGTELLTTTQEGLQIADLTSEAVKKTATATDVVNTTASKGMGAGLTTASAELYEFCVAIQAAKIASAFANGGIMTSQGSMPLRMYANGGIARSAQVAVFGEGSKPEAYVPLPDGRSIPVTLDLDGLDGEKSSAGGNNFNISINVTNNSDGSSQEETSGNQDDADMKKLATKLKDIVKVEIVNQSRPGGLLYNMNNKS